MSLWGAEADGIIAVVRGAVPEMPALTVGAERGVRPPSELTPSEMPHLFVYNPQGRVTAIEWLQSEVRTTWEADLWISGTQELAATYRDAIRAALAANRTLTGAVIDCAMLFGAVLEDPTTPYLKVLAMQFETLRWEG